MAQFSLLDPACPPREALETSVFDLVRTSAALAAVLPGPTRQAVCEAIRLAETFYSLSIDGHWVHPAHIEHALSADWNANPAVRGLQRESLAYVRAERFLVNRLAEERLDLAAPAFLKALHWELYSRIPEEFRWVEPGTAGARLRVIPGELRTHGVDGPRSAAEPQAIDSLLGRFRTMYEPGRLGPVDRVIAAAASHHRLLWVHPFTGGNGRVARLFTAAYLHRSGVEGALTGTWSMSRGLARARHRYRDLLASADARQRHDLDGREMLSPRGLAEFARFFLDSCREEVAFVRQALRPEVLVPRLSQYVALRGSAMAPGGPLHAEAASLLRDVALRGEISRGEAARITGMAVSEGRKVLSSLVRDRLLVSDSPKGPVRIGLPAHAVPYLLPDLYPADLVLREAPRSAIEAA